MRRYRWAFAILTTLVVAAVAYAGLHARRGDGVGNGATAELIPVDQREPAADLAGIRGWVNSPALTLSALRGKVVLIDFWTFSCVNCVRTFPHLSALQERYAGHGLVIVGVHSPEFDFEKNAGNVAAAVRRDGVSWPVALDSDMGTWNAYGNRFWPAEYLIDRDGRVAYVHFGEGAYAETDAAVATLVGSAAAGGAAPSSAGPSTNAPEVYAGSARGVLDNQEGFGPAGEPVTYGGAGPPTAPNRLRLSGVWSDHGEYVEAVSAG